MTKPLRHTTIVLAALLAAAFAAFSAPAASAAPAALQQATDRCWLDVINDWVDNNQVDGTYAIPCYTQAIQELNSRPDIAGYSSAVDDIHRALLAAIRQDRGNGPGGGLGGGGNNSSDSGHITPGPGGKDGGGGGKGGILGIGGPSDATSVPLPLIILGALAVLLALAAVGTWAARRYQTRRFQTRQPAPAPAVSRRR